VVAVQRGNSVTVEFNGRTYEVTDQARVELMDETFVSYGLRHHDASQRPRLAFEAPTHVRIRTI
jgi:hypothetical protein